MLQHLRMSKSLIFLFLLCLLSLLPIALHALSTPAHHVSTLSSHLSGMGVKISPSIEFKSLPGYGISVVASQDIPADAVVMSVPSSVPLTTTEPPSGFDAPKGVPSSEWKSYTWSQRLAFKLKSLPDSPYKACLPTSFPSSSPRLPLTSTPEEIYQRLVLSRTFSSPPLPTFSKTIPLTFTVLTLPTLALGMYSISDVANAASFIACSIVFKDFVLPKLSPESTVYALTPGVDFFNHDGVPSCEVKQNYFTGDTEVTSTVVVPRGEQLTITYGEKHAAAWDAYYGFVPSGSEGDRLVEGIRGWPLEEVEEVAGEVSGDGMRELEKKGLLDGARDGFFEGYYLINKGKPEEGFRQAVREIVGGSALDVKPEVEAKVGKIMDWAKKRSKMTF